MGRGSGFFLGLLGLILPGSILYLQWDNFTELYMEGLFYFVGYYLSGQETELWWISNDWLKPKCWGGNIGLSLYLATFALTVLGLLVILKSARGGSILFLLAGVASLGGMIAVFSNIDSSLQITNLTTNYPIPIGAIFLLLAGFVGRRD